MLGRRCSWTGVRSTRPGAKASLPSSAVRLWPHKRSYFSAQRNGMTNAHGERERAWGWRKGFCQDVLICRRSCPALRSWHVAGQLLPGRDAELGEGLVEVVPHGAVGQEGLGADLLVRGTSGGQPNHLQFRRGEPGERVT